jgi:hypothetical protein
MLDPAELDDVIVIVAATYWVTVISQAVATSQGTMKASSAVLGKPRERPARRSVWSER